jgi:hypothetical protein
MGLEGVMNDRFLGSVAGNLLQQQGQSYLARTHSYVQSKMGFLSGGMVAYLFAVTPEYVLRKLAMLLLPFLRRWTYARQPDPGPHKWEPPRQDVNAPDLYIPITALWTYCLLVGFSLFLNQVFRPEVIYSTVSSSMGAWVLHTIVLKAMLWALGIHDVSVLELSSYSGYSFVYGCCVLLGRLVSTTAGHGVWAYCGFAYALFLVRTFKRIIRQDPRYSHYGAPAPGQNYVLLALAVLQFPLLAYFSYRA